MSSWCIWHFIIIGLITTAISGFIDYDNKLGKSGESDMHETECQCHTLENRREREGESKRKKAIPPVSHVNIVCTHALSITYGIPIAIKLTWLLRDATE